MYKQTQREGGVAERHYQHIFRVKTYAWVSESAKSVAELTTPKADFRRV